MKRFRIWAESISHVYLDVEAETEDEAYEIAKDTDGGEFIEDGFGDWILGDVVELED